MNQQTVGARFFITQQHKKLVLATILISITIVSGWYTLVYQPLVIANNLLITQIHTAQSEIERLGILTAQVHKLEQENNDLSHNCQQHICAIKQTPADALQQLLDALSITQPSELKITPAPAVHQAWCSKQLVTFAMTTSFDNLMRFFDKAAQMSLYWRINNMAIKPMADLLEIQLAVTLYSCDESDAQ